MKPKRISVTVNCVASTTDLASRGERTIEFFDADTQRGGLISFMREEDGRLRIQPYCLDKGIIVRDRNGEIVMEGTE